MAHRLLFLLTVWVVGSSAASAHAYPWMIRHGFAQCGSCHVDPMGGETLTGMGRVMGETLLAMPWADNPPTDAGKFQGRLEGFADDLSNAIARRVTGQG